jgi:DNA-directed RNA polymerase subunit E'/Rpb7
MLFVPIKFKTFVQLTPEELDSKYQDRIYEKLRLVYEGNCTKFGFILQNSIEILKRSCGNFIKQNFNGAIRFDVICRAMTCNPVVNSVVEAVVKNKNLLGILAESSMEIDNEKVPILDIIIPIKSAGIISDINIENVSIGDTITVEVMGKKYQMKDKKISIIGRIVTPTKEPVIEDVDVIEIDDTLNEEDIEITDNEVLEDEDDDDEEDDLTKKKITVTIDDDDDESDEESETNEFEGIEEDFEEPEEDVAFDDGVEEY